MVGKAKAPPKASAPFRKSRLPIDSPGVNFVVCFMTFSLLLEFCSEHLSTRCFKQERRKRDSASAERRQSEIRMRSSYESSSPNAWLIPTSFCEIRPCGTRRTYLSLTPSVAWKHPGFGRRSFLCIPATFTQYASSMPSSFPTPVPAQRRRQPQAVRVPARNRPAPPACRRAIP